MIGAALILVALACAGLGIVLLRRAGPGWRVGRLLAAAPARSLADAHDIAQRGQPAYVRLHGRIDSDEQFPGEDDRPLVFRRRRLQRRAGRSGWQTFDDERLSVPFAIGERGQRVVIDADALGDGLVVVPRIADGRAGDLGEDDFSLDRSSLPDLPSETPVRLRVEHVSTIDHATAAGVPQLAADGSGAVVLGPGLGRPLILTTLDRDEAMRVLAAEHRTSLLVAVLLMVAALIAGLAGLVLVLLGM